MTTEVSATIYAQLGGNQFRVMTGASSLDFGKDTFSCRIPKAKNKIRGVVITLNGKDLYDVRFVASISKPQIEVYDAAKYTDVYASQLQEIFTKETGLLTKL